VERGETIIITRHGRAIARITPEAQRRQQEIKEALDSIKALGQEIAREHGSVSIEEIVSSIHEGHKY
jgi:antitoxin (DNA-binding transcriptional repressor) of toxin-antitoxin stability system